MMGTVLDAFTKEDRIEVTFSDLHRLMRESTKAEITMNTVNCNVLHRYIHGMTTGKPKDIDLKTNIKREDNGNTDEVVNAIHEKFEEHINDAGRDERADGDTERAASRDTKLTY